MSDILGGLNEQQRKGVITTEGPVLILAGAGSGKTRVLTHRVAYLIDEKGVAPYHIMAITFTNKAAGEMRERIDNMVGYGAESVWVATFHSTCVRILRRFIERLGYDNNFTIYDTDDQKSVMKEVCKALQIDTKIYKEKTFLNVISSAKNELISEEEFLIRAAGDFNKTRQGQVYREYQARLRSSNALDFDDLIMKTVQLFKQDPEVLNYYQNRFRYIMVDEYQDTNHAQFELIRLLADAHRNLCVVGDDDQSIYKFRGANIYNILNFEDQYPDATVIKLEQNYRSTQNILDAANHVIANNVGRKAKKLWTDQGDGEKIRFKQFDSAYEEAQFIASDIRRYVQRENYHYSDCSILYRTNAQSRILEEKLVADNIPYKIIGGVNFYSRREVKDLLSYLKVIDNAQDELSVRRIINVPRRGIGAATLNKVAAFANANGITFYEALKRADTIPTIGRAAAKIRPFVNLIESMRSHLQDWSISQILNKVIEETGYVNDLKAEATDEANARIDNIDELINKTITYEQDSDEPTLSGFLEEVSLVADIDNLDEDADYVALMTLHSAKGLEFPIVYLAGMEDGLFPSFMSITADDADAEIEEERRLCYVGITRAREHLIMTAARTRMVRGETQYNAVSRFVKEIPKNLIEGDIYTPKPHDRYSFVDEEQAAEDGRPKYGSAAYGGVRGGGFGAGSGGHGASGAGHSGRRSPKGVQTSAQKYAKNFGTKIQKGNLDYGVGDRVRHIKFGVGTVESIVDGGRDYEVTVNFDKSGTKKMFASFAKLKKV